MEDKKKKEQREIRIDRLCDSAEMELLKECLNIMSVYTYTLKLFKDLRKLCQET